jgi:hypothetical protein
MAGLLTTQNTTSKSTGKVVPYDKYKSHQALRQKITGAESFGRNVSKIKFEQRVGKQLHTKKGEMIKTKDLHKEVKKIISKAGSSGISGMRLKQKLKKELGLKYKDADKVIRAATYHLAKPEESGLTEQDKARILKRTTAINQRDRAGEIKAAKEHPETIIGDAKEEGHTRLKTKEKEYSIGIGSEKVTTGDKYDSQTSAKTSSAETSAFAGSDNSSAASIGEGTGVKEQAKVDSQEGTASVKSTGAKIIEMHTHPAFIQRESRTKDSKYVPSSIAAQDEKQIENHKEQTEITAAKSRSARSSNQSDFDPQDLIPTNRDTRQEYNSKDNNIRKAA